MRERFFGHLLAAILAARRRAASSYDARTTPTTRDRSPRRSRGTRDTSLSWARRSPSSTYRCAAWRASPPATGLFRAQCGRIVRIGRSSICSGGYPIGERIEGRLQGPVGAKDGRSFNCPTAVLAAGSAQPHMVHGQVSHRWSLGVSVSNNCSVWCRRRSDPRYQRGSDPQGGYLEVEARTGSRLGAGHLKTAELGLKGAGCCRA